VVPFDDVYNLSVNLRGYRLELDSFAVLFLYKNGSAIGPATEWLRQTNAGENIPELFQLQSSTTIRLSAGDVIEAKVKCGNAVNDCLIYGTGGFIRASVFSGHLVHP